MVPSRESDEQLPPFATVFRGTPCVECAGSGRCPECGDGRSVSARRRCLTCAGLAVCSACSGTGGALVALTVRPAVVS